MNTDEKFIKQEESTNRPNHHFGHVIEWHCKLKSYEQNRFFFLSFFNVYNKFFFLYKFWHLTLHTHIGIRRGKQSVLQKMFRLSCYISVFFFWKFESYKKGRWNIFIHMVCRCVCVFVVFYFLLFSTFCILCAICLFSIVIFIMVWFSYNIL